MKIFSKRFSVILVLFWVASLAFADGVVTNQAKIKLKENSFLIHKGDLKISPNGFVQLDGMLTVEGEIINQNGFNGLVLGSENGNQASLIYTTGTPQANVFQYLLANKKYHIGAPLVGTTASSLLLSSNNPSSKLYFYEESSAMLREITTNEYELISGQGYYLKLGTTAEDGIQLLYEGNASAEDYTWNQESNPILSSDFTGFNLIANPYTSAIDWDFEGIQMKYMEKSIWVWDTEKSKYLFRNKSGYGSLSEGIIPVGQGFMVKAKSANTELLIPAQARIHSSTNTYKSTQEPAMNMDYLVLELEQDTYSDEVWVGFQEGTTDAFDDGIDVSKLFTFENEPQIYAANETDLYCLDMIEEPINESKTVSLQLRVAENGSFKLKLKEYNGFSGYDVQLEDKKTSILQDVFSMGDYVFDVNASDDSERFLLHFSPSSTVSVGDLDPDQMVGMYANHQALYIKSYGNYENQSKQVLIYDLSGKLLQEAYLEPGQLQKIQLQTSQKILVVKLFYPDKVHTEKVLNL